MFRRVASQKRHLAVSQSSENFLLLSYGDYFEPGNVRWGGLRFFNDDLIHPACGFPLHFHDEIETDCEGLCARPVLVCRDELAKITNVLDEKVSTFFLQPIVYNGERRQPFAFFISPQQ